MLALSFRFLAVFAMVAAFASSSLSQEPKVEESRGTWNELVGNWTVISIEKSGREIRPINAGFNNCRIVAPTPGVEKGTGSVGWLILQQDRRLFCELEVKNFDLFESPKQLDFFTTRNIEEGEGGRQTISSEYEAIYRLIGEELTVCLSKGKGSRIKAFKTEKGSEQMLIKMKRAAKK